ncbi:MAG: hypothetical protein IAF38_08805 [Bacteroidia bacterium]|nr:hypothetical protein [Bacteroidia bacterium]
MKKTILLVTAVAISFASQAQLKNLLKKKDKTEETTETNESASLPKGIDVYTTEHSDASGFSGKYFTKYPLCFSAKNMMNMPKPFQLSELTWEYRPEEFTGTIHWIKDEAKNQVRYKNADETKEVDLEIQGGAKIGKANIEKNGYYAFKFYNKLMPGATKQGFKDGVVFYRYSKDPEIILIADATIEKKDGVEKPSFFKDNTCTFLGGCMNVISKNKAKLADWDSTKIANAIFDEIVLMRKNLNNAAGEVFDLKPQAVNDDAREKEYFALIKPFASADKPAAWGDRMDYVYIVKDWKTTYDKSNSKIITGRSCMVTAVSHGWPNNECKWIYCAINQNWDGTKFGPSFMGGFIGALGPISCQKAAEFKH